MLVRLLKIPHFSMAVVLLIPILICFIHCEQKEHTNPVDPKYSGSDEEAVSTLIAKGWKLFNEKKYSPAKNSFTAAINMYQQTIEATLGLGWCYTMAGDLNSAKTQFEWIVLQDADQINALAGLAIIQRDIPEYLQAITNAECVLSKDNLYVFSRNSNINHKVLRLIIAECCVRLGSQYFPKAQGHLDILEPGNGLKMNDHETWVVDGSTYDSYAAALVALIKKIQKNIS